MSTPTKALPALALALVVSLSSCEMLFSGPEADVDISPPSWILGVWENGDTGEAIEFTSTDVLFDYVRVVVRPQFSGLSSIDFEQASTRSSSQSTRAGMDTGDLNREKP